MRGRIAADQHHEEALARWEAALAPSVRLVSSFHVLDEALTLLIRRTTPGWAAGWAEDALACSAIEWVEADTEYWRRAIQMVRKFGDQGVSCTDCLSFAIMRRLGIKKVLGFDRHFAAVGFSFL